MKRWQSILLAALITIVTLYYAFRNVTWDTLGSVLAHGRYIFLVPCIVFSILALALRSFRWRSLLNQRMTLQHSLNILNASYLFYNILPFRLGEVVRMYLPTRLTPPISIFTTLSSIVVERILDVLSVVIFAIVAIAMAPVSPQIEAGARISGVVAVIGVVVLIVFAVRRDLAHRFLALMLRIVPPLKRFNLEALLDRALDGIAPLGNVRGALAAFGWTALSWLATMLVSYMTLSIFFDKPQWNAILLSMAVASLSVAVPAAPGNIGPFEGAVVFGLTASGFILASDPQQQTQALAYAVTLHFVSTLISLIWGMVGLAQEHISLGEVLQSARQMANRPKSEPVIVASEG